jgi:hypothetical protein
MAFMKILCLRFIKKLTNPPGEDAKIALPLYGQNRKMRGENWRIGKNGRQQEMINMNQKEMGEMR